MLLTILASPEEVGRASYFVIINHVINDEYNYKGILADPFLVMSALSFCQVSSNFVCV